MVLKHFTFIQDDPDFLNARPGSPHPFFYLISSASSSPDVWTNCIGGLAAGVASPLRQLLSWPPAIRTMVPVRDEAEGADEAGEQAPGRGSPRNQIQRRVSGAANSLFGRVGGMAVGLLDTVGSYSSGLGPASNRDFGHAGNKRGPRLGIRAFEVANTIFRGAKLMEFLSEEAIRHLTEVVLPSEGVQCLVSEDMTELLKIAALDKKEELKVFLGEIFRYGNLCIDLQWHDLDRYFEKEFRGRQEQLCKVRTDAVMQQLMYLMQKTAELYYELQILDRLEQDYRDKLSNYDLSNASHRGDRNELSILRADLKTRRKHVNSLKKNSLWSRTLEEVMEELTEIGSLLLFEIDEVCGNYESDLANGYLTDRRTLGSACLDLQYANTITHIHALVSQPSSDPPNSRDALYRGLPGHLQAALCRKLRTFRVPEELTDSEIKGIMEDRLRWLVPMAAKTIKAHHTFCWFGESANFATSSNGKSSEVIRIETLHHADIEKTDFHILGLLMWLHILVSLSRGDNAARDAVLSSLPWPNLSSRDVVFDKVMLQRPRTGRSQKFGDAKAQGNKRRHRLATSSGVSSTTETDDPVAGERLLSQNMNSESDWIKVLDIIDGVCTI